MKQYKVTTTEQFECELNVIFEYIALNSPNRAWEFRSKLLKQIHTLDCNPFRCRKRQNSDESIREMIFKGYVIIFAIEADSVIVFGIYKANTWRKQ